MDQQPSPIQQSPAEDSLQTFVPTKNKPALMAYYFGVFGLIPVLGLPLSIVAIVLGIMGFKKYQQAPTPGAKGHAMTGLILGVFELLVFVGFVITILVKGS